jgi:ribosomal protein S27AE
MSCDCQSPRIEYDNLGIFMRFHKRRGLIGDEIMPVDEYYLDHKDFNDWDEMEAHIWKNFDPAVVLRVYMLSHGGETFNTTGFSCPWDSGQVGFIFASKEAVRKEYSVKRVTKKITNLVRKVLVAEIEDYDRWVCGECCSEDE